MANVNKIQVDAQTYDIEDATARQNQGTHASNHNNPHQVTAQQAGADPTGTASQAVAAHNQSNTAHAELFKKCYQASTADLIYMSMLTADNYYEVMKAWFQANGAALLSDLTELCDRWYTITRKGWKGGVTFAAPDQSSISTGTKTGDNATLTCTPSTNTVANTDDYKGIPLFAPIDCNVELSDAGEPKVTAIDGITSVNVFSRTSPSKIVCVMQMAGWCKRSSTDTTFSFEYTDQVTADGFFPLPEAVRMDGTVRTWVVHGKYLMGDDYGCYSGAAPRVWDVSHNSQLSAIRTAHGNRYCGKTSADDAFVKWMTYIKYASLTLDNIMAGCIAYYNATVRPARAETGVQRVLITTTQGAGLLVGSTVCLGSTAYGSKSTQCSVVDRKKITSIETVTIADTEKFSGDGTKTVFQLTGTPASLNRVLVDDEATTAYEYNPTTYQITFTTAPASGVENIKVDYNEANYSAVTIDNGGVTFDTTTALYLTTMQWYSGSCDNVLGNDGSPISNSDRKEIFKLQGIEMIAGCYETMADTILQYELTDGAYYCRPYVCRDATKLATSRSADYEACDYATPCPAASSWNYIRKLGIDAEHPELMFPLDITGGSSSTFTRDAMYILAESTAACEWLSLGCLNGDSYCGLSCVVAGNGLSISTWNFGGRLSVTGNRGEWAA